MSSVRSPDALPLHPLVCPTPLDSPSVSCWWASHLDMGAEVLLGLLWEGPRQGVPAVGACGLGSHLQLCAPVLLWARGDGSWVG